MRDDGSIGSDPAVLDENIKKTTADTKKSLKKLEDSLKEGLADLKDAEAVLKGYEDQYASVRDLILDMPPEARGTLEDKLLTPVKKNRDDLVPAILEMRKANATLAGAVKTEQDYVKLLEKLLVNKDAYDKKKKTFGKYCEVLDDLTNVDDWWGHFGPAKATTAKVSAQKSGFDKLILAFSSKKKAKA